MTQRKSKSTSPTNTLKFITDASLRSKVESSLEITSFLYLKRNEKDISSGFAKEIRRMEILYAASIIEAILIHIFKREGRSVTKTDYKDVHVLPSIHQSDSSAPLVVARQIKLPRPDREIMLDNLVELFSRDGLIKGRLKGKIDITRRIRNTFHLAKSRKGMRCNAATVNTAYDAVIETLSVAREFLAKKKEA